MFRVPTLIAAALVLPLAGCGEGTAPAIVPAKAPSTPAPDADYLSPPVVSAARPAGASVLLSGTAPARSQVRLATPEGEAVFAEADARGAWTLALPSATQARIFGLSATQGERLVQSEGYLLITPLGEPVLLRAGGGAVRIGRQGPAGPDAVDFDREGGAVVSGRAPAGAPLRINIDGGQIADGRTDAAGRYAVALAQPLAGGPHQIDVFGDATENPVTIDASAAAPISNGPFRSASVPAGLRVDWLTPGGGVQSTILLK